MADRLTAKDRMLRAIAERDLQQQFVDAAHLLGWKTMHIGDSRKVVNRGGNVAIVGDAGCKGWPDLTLVRAGRMLAVEVKTEMGKLSPEQQEWLDDLALVPGCTTLVLRPSNWDEGVALLRNRVHAAA